MVNILIVDDEHSIQKILKEVLEAQNYVCSLASNAADARSSNSEKM